MVLLWGVGSYISYMRDAQVLANHKRSSIREVFSDRVAVGKLFYIFSIAPNFKNIQFLT